MKWYKLAGKKFGRLQVLKAGISKKAKCGTRKFWVCKCDCGTTKSVITASLVSGKTKSCGCLLDEMHEKRRKGELRSGAWKGGKVVDDGGYIRVWKPGHPNANNSGYVLEHRLAMSEKLGRPLKMEETVHHKNGVKNDNRLENLELWSSSHPAGQTIESKIEWCLEFLDKYTPEYKAKKKMVEALYPITIQER